MAYKQTATPLLLSGVSGVLVSGRVLLLGFSITEANGAAATYEFYDGLGTTGIRIYRQAIGANALSQIGPIATPIVCQTGLYYNQVAGVQKGVVFVATHNWDDV